MKNLEKLVETLIRLPNETPWLEFKHNNYIPEMIGERISGLANAATLDDRTVAYMIWGVHDQTHEILGTDHDLQSIHIGRDELEGWLRQRLSRNVDFKFETIEMGGKRVGVLSITAAVGYPVSFQKNDYIRFGSITRKLNEFVEKRGQLWDKLRNSKFEVRIAKDELAPAEVVALLDCQTYFDLKGVPYPTTQEGVIHYFCEEGLTVRQDNGLYSITNLGAILFAKRLVDFPTVSRKAIRVVRYKGENKLEMENEDTGSKGYAVGYTEVDEWLEYSVKVASDGQYNVSVNVATASETSKILLLVDDKAIGDTVAFEKIDTTWNVYKEIDIGTVDLAAGEHVLKLAIAGSYVNVDWIRFGEGTMGLRKILPAVSPEAVVPRLRKQGGMLFVEKNGMRFDLTGHRIR